MKKTFLACLIALAAAFQVSAHSGAQVRLAFNLQSDFNMNEFSFDSIVNDSFEDTNWIYWGSMIEVVVGHTGFGITGLVNLPSTVKIDERSSAISWDGGVFLNHHLFGAGNLLDPYLGIGFNCAGGVVIRRPDIYGETNWGRPAYDMVENGDLSLALYPYAAAGLALDLDGILLGTKLAVQPFQLGVTGIPRYDTPTYSLDIYGGLALGGHR